MAGKSEIEWTDATWNPIVGCSIVSPGCTNCYAMRMASRIEAMNLSAHTRPGTDHASHYAGTTKKVNGNAVWTGKLALAPDQILLAPLHWKKLRKIFVNSMGDLFHEDAPDEWIDKVFAVMALCPQHTFQVLTKRAERMQRYCSNRRLLDTIVSVGAAIAMNAFLKPASNHPHPYKTEELRSFPLSNVWLGVSAERQQEADERIPLLLQTPAAIRFVSCEPLLGPINLFDFIGPWGPTPQSLQAPPQLDWIIVGGESGPGARPMHPDWARSLRDQCEAAGVKFFFKQWGVWGRVGDQRPSPNHLPQDADICTRVGKKLAGRLLDGREHNEFPEVSA